MARHVLSWRDDHLSFEMQERLVAAIRGGGPRAEALGCLGIGALSEDDREARETVQHRVSDLLDGQDEAVSRIALDLISTLPYRIEATALAMLRCTGMDPAIMILVAHALSRDDAGGWANVRLPAFTLTAGPARRAEARVSIEKEGRIAVSAPFAADTAWIDEGAIHIERPFPHAVCLAMDGRALKDVVDHPLLTPQGLTISKVTMGVTGRDTTISTDIAPRRIGMADLTLEGTRPDRSLLAVEKAPRQRVDNTPSF